MRGCWCLVGGFLPVIFVPFQSIVKRPQTRGVHAAISALPPSSLSVRADSPLRVCAGFAQTRCSFC
jgi:hypothetical protein